MTLNKNSNDYTFGFSIAMVVIVGAVLSIAAIQLKPFQTENVKMEKMQNILYSISVLSTREEASDLFDKYVIEQVVLNNKGEVLEGVKAFDIDIQKQYKEVRAKARTEESVEYPLFICEKDGDKIYVVPMVGTGLWGPVWGFVSLKSDLNTVFGATFDHKTETPGLGAEISEDSFGDQFKNDVIYTDGEVSMKILKGGGGLEDPSGIDGITGGTITSVGVEEMVIRSFQVYKPYFETIK
jgi:Na+-transporting NADH:ubiquinone oxidoreductase subunit C